MSSAGLKLKPVPLDINRKIDPLRGAAMLEIRCPKCDHPIPHLAEFAGKEAVCVNCGTHFHVPPVGFQVNGKTPRYEIVWLSAENDPTISPAGGSIMR
jgi:hypothetical protein